ncbi:SCO family protein [Glaciecola sp. MH2013]|uniref:SCO family protein n=1 Tax=Glaciecola sp. MH2013 TaxID=2785524 RepID=UPI00189CED78|nr:SCO family protein [Glaciecola sp. MH2013]MBF7071812.1 SCO family protein [Glaciecola sp. MH2013]
MNKFLSTITKCKLVFLVSAALLYSTANASESLPYYDSEEFSPHWLQSDDKSLANFHRIPAFSFTNQNGLEISQETVEDKIYVAGFFFSTCPGICPMVRSKLSEVQDAFLDDPELLIIQHSIRPSTDSVALLKSYAEENGIVSGKWHLLTGDKDKIYSLAKGAYFASEDLGNIQNTNDFLHTESLLLIDKNRYIRGVYNGLNSASVSYLIADIKTLKAEQ